MYKSDLEAAIAGREAEKARADKAEAELERIKKGDFNKDVGVSREWTCFFSVIVGLFLGDIFCFSLVGKNIYTPSLHNYLGKLIIILVLIGIICGLTKLYTAKEKMFILITSCFSPLSQYLIYLLFVR